MILPFKIQFERVILTNIDKLELLSIIRGNLIQQGIVSEKIEFIDTNGLIFKNGFMTHNIFHAVEKGKFEMEYLSANLKLTYSIFTMRYNFILFFISSAIAFWKSNFISKWYLAVLLYLLIIWVGTVIANRYFFNKVVSALENFHTKHI